MTINTKYSLGEKVKVYFNPTDNQGISQNIAVMYGEITEIVMKRDMFGNLYVMYRFSENNCLYSENSLMRALN